MRETRAAAQLDPDLGGRQERLPDRLPDRVRLRRGAPPGGAIQEELPPHRVLLRVPSCLQM